MIEAGSIENIIEGENFNFNFLVTDPDIGDEVVINISGLPEWLSIDENNNFISGVPGYEDSGNYSFNISLEDSNGAIISEDFIFDVLDATIQTSETTYSIENSNYKDITYSGNENFSGTGNDLNNLITASIGDDKIFGGLGNDTLIGNDGDDEIYGEGGVDRIFGGAGDDILSGGQGNDVITDLVGINNISGGDGDDLIYVFFNENVSRDVDPNFFEDNYLKIYRP